MSARQLLEAVAQRLGDDDVAVSVITVLELAHGISRADNPERRAKRQMFLDEFLRVVPVQPVSVRVALRAGYMDGHHQAQGIRIPLSDLLIGSTALELGYRVATANLRHFQQIPELIVVSF